MKTVLIKLGGYILDDAKLIKKLAADLSQLRSMEISVVIVHGGSKAIDKALQIHQMKSEFYQGQRVTSAQMMDVIEMVLCGHVNKTLVRTLNSVGIQAIGLSGVDNNMLQCDYFGKEYGFVGRVKSVNASIVKYFLSTQIVPIIAPIGIDKNGNALNVNADWVASYIACELNVDKLIYLTDQDGIYNDSGNIIAKLNISQLKKMITSGIVKDGMLTKAKTILHALNHGLNNIHIINAKTCHALIDILCAEKELGTVCYKN